MSVNIPTHYGKQFADNIMLLLQQQGSRLRGKVTEKADYRGEQVSPVDQIGSVEMQPVTTRFAPMGRVDADTDRRWMLPESFDLPQLVDSFDLLKTLNDPKSKYVQNAVAACGRRIDRTIISAFTGAAKTGKEGATSTTFLAGNSIAVNFGAGGAVGLTVAKLREARKILGGHEVDLDSDPIYAGVTVTQLDNLLAEAQVISLDYNERPVLVDGKIKRFLGIEFVQSQLFAENLVAGDMVCPIWAKSGMHLGLWSDMKTDISERKDLQGLPWQVYVYMTLGATRLEEKKVVKVACDV